MILFSQSKILCLLIAVALVENTAKTIGPLLSRIKKQGLLSYPVPEPEE